MSGHTPPGAAKPDRESRIGFGPSTRTALPWSPAAACAPGDKTRNPPVADIQMTRSDLVNQLAERFGQLTQRDTEFAVKTILDAMSDALARGHRIEIRGFGSFSINRRPPRLGRNPRSGEKVTIPEKLVPHFKPGKALRESVDERLPVQDDLPATP